MDGKYIYLIVYAVRLAGLSSTWHCEDTSDSGCSSSALLCLAVKKPKKRAPENPKYQSAVVGDW